MRALLAMVVFGLGMVVVACGGETSSASSDGRGEVEDTVGPVDASAPTREPRVLPTDPTATSIPGRPVPRIRSAPGLVLETVDGSTKVIAGIGTRCWAGMCIDYIGPVTNATPVVLPAGTGFNLTFEHGSPSDTFEGWYTIPAGKRPEPTTGLDGAAWSIHPDDIIEVKPGAPMPARAPGQYIYVVQGFWAGEGDVMYSFWLEVR